MHEDVLLGELLAFTNGTSRPADQPNGAYKIFGANGVIGRTDQTNAEARSVIIGRVGSYCGSVHFSVEPCWVTENAIIARAKEGVDPRYAYYALRSLNLHNHRIGSGQPLLTQQILSRIRTIKPPLPTQQAIASLLGALDDKIATNERIAQTSDQLRSLLLSQFLNTPGNSTPRPLSTLADFVNGRAFTKNATGTGRMVVRIADINSGPGGSTVYSDIDVPDVHLVRPGDVLFAWSGSLTVARWFRPEAIVNQHIFKVIPRDGWPAWVLYEMVLSALSKFRSIAADKATTMGHIQRHHLDEPVLAPEPELIGNLNERLGGLWDRALAAEQESLVLGELRNTLLPRLISGEVRVREAEKVVEEVL